MYCIGIITKVGIIGGRNLLLDNMRRHYYHLDICFFVQVQCSVFKEPLNKNFPQPPTITTKPLLELFIVIFNLTISQV